jgi:hypothetical protein
MQQELEMTLYNEEEGGIILPIHSIDIPSSVNRGLLLLSLRFTDFDKK